MRGLLPSANIAALFDSHLISFDGSGKMLVCPSISCEQRSLLGLPARLRRAPSLKQCRYLAQHRENFARRAS